MFSLLHVRTCTQTKPVVMSSSSSSIMSPSSSSAPWFFWEDDTQRGHDLPWMRARVAHESQGGRETRETLEEDSHLHRHLIKPRDELLHDDSIPMLMRTFNALITDTGRVTSFAVMRHRLEFFLKSVCAVTLTTAAHLQLYHAVSAELLVKTVTLDDLMHWVGWRARVRIVYARYYFHLSIYLYIHVCLALYRPRRGLFAVLPTCGTPTPTMFGTLCGKYVVDGCG
jgi:hypothetical protein